MYEPDVSTRDGDFGLRLWLELHQRLKYKNFRLDFDR